MYLGFDVASEFSKDVFSAQPFNTPLGSQARVVQGKESLFNLASIKSLKEGSWISGSARMSLKTKKTSKKVAQKKKRKKSSLLTCPFLALVLHSNNPQTPHGACFDGELPEGITIFVDLSFSHPMHDPILPFS